MLGKLSKATRDFYYSTAAYLTVRGMDIASTTLAFSKPDTNEVNPLTDYFIDKLGVLEGQMVKEVLLSGVFLGLAHKLNGLQKESQTKLSKESGTKFVQVASVLSLAATVNNLLVYLS